MGNYEIQRGSTQNSRNESSNESLFEHGMKK